MTCQNARLIAAAPALYEALAECAGDLEVEINARYQGLRVADGTIHPSQQHRYDRDMGAVARARAALSLARGDSPKEASDGG